MIKCAVLVLSAISSMALPALAETWIVDVNPGPGADFTAIQPAVDAAAPGDLSLGRPGSYLGFTLNKPLVVMGEPGVSASTAPASPSRPRAPGSR